MTINVDVNLPQLRIAIVTYESATISLTGQFAGNVVSVDYAGYGDTSDQSCGFSVGQVVFNNLPAGVTPVIINSPNVTVSNSNGFATIICGSSCNLNVSQGGCNTAEQIADYFLQQYPGSNLYAHFTDYNCWNNISRNLSAGGNCCAQVVAGFPLGNDQPEEISLFPNPANQLINVNSNKMQPYMITSLLGQKLKAGNLDKGQQQLDITSLDKGVYLFHLQESKIVRRFFVD